MYNHPTVIRAFPRAPNYLPLALQQRLQIGAWAISISQNILVLAGPHHSNCASGVPNPNPPASDGPKRGHCHESKVSIAHIFPLLRKRREETIATHPGNRARTLLFPLSLLALALVFTFVSLVPAFAQSDEEKSLAPSNLSVSLVDNKVTLTWDAPSADADSVAGYQILRRNPKVDDKGVFHTVENNTESTATNYVDTTVEAGEKYFYRVKAWRGTELSGMSKFSKIKLPDDYDPDQAGSEGSDSGGSDSDQQDPTPTPTPTPTPAPEPQTDPADLAPTNLSVTLASEGGLYLDWDAPTAEAFQCHRIRYFPFSWHRASGNTGERHAVYGHRLHRQFCDRCR